MDHSSYDQEHQETVARMRAAPLTCFKKNGEPYTRHQAVEDEIARALAMPKTDWCDQRWRIETIVHLIRLCRSDNNPHALGLLSHMFFERVKPVVNRWSRGYSPTDNEVIQTAVANELGDLLNRAPPSRTSEYLEVDAATVVQQATLRAQGPDRPKARDFQSEDRDDDGRYTPTVDRLASQAPDPLQQLLAKVDEAEGGMLRLLNVIIDPRHREAFVLRHLEGWPLKDSPDGAPTLCEKFGMSDRQIRNWINTAIEQMRAALGEE